MRVSNSNIEWQISHNLVDYADAILLMQSRVQDIINNHKNELVWFLEHPPLYTAGTSSKDTDLLNPKGLPVYNTNRGGQYTYHGDGQLVTYAIIDLNKRGRDVRRYVETLEKWIIKALSYFDINAEQREGRIGLWVLNKDGNEEKIAAIGIRITKWVAWHGFAINVNPNLDHFNGIVPCGLKDFTVTSFEKLGIKITTEELIKILQHTCPFN